MVFSSLLFYGSFAVVGAGYYIVPNQNIKISPLLISVCFLCLGGTGHPVLLMLFHFFNWGTGLLIDRFPEN